MATLNIGIKIAYSNAISGSHLAGTNETLVLYLVGAGEYSEVDVQGVSTGLGPSNSAYVWVGTADINNQARAYGNPTTINVIEVGQVVSNAIVPTPGLFEMKSYLAVGQKVGYRRSIGSGITYTVSIRGFVNTL